MTLYLYNLFWKILKKFIPGYLNYRIKNGKEEETRIHERYGISLRNREDIEYLIWLHASSVGESVAALALANSMLKIGFNKKNLKFLITTNTVTSSKFVNSKIKLGFPGIHQYNPLDHYEYVNKFLTNWKPDMAIFLESEFWPNLINLTSSKKIPTILASSQMSKKSSRFWRGFGKLLARKIFKDVELVLAVDHFQAKLFKTLGAKNIKSLTSLKSIAEKPPIDIDYIKQIKHKVKNKKILLAASTHPGEEEILIQLANSFRHKAIHNILIIIAPRHIRRSQSIQNLIKNAGYDLKCRSKKELPDKSDYFYLADTMGEMGSLIEISNLVFVAGSMVKKIGGHNPAEAANFGKAVIMGPYTEKCNAQINDLVWSGGGIKIDLDNKYKNNFIDVLHELINEPLRMEDMGKNALEASGYAQMRADEASEYLYKIFEDRVLI